VNFIRVVQFVRRRPFDPGERPVLGAGGGDAEGHRRAAPFDDPVHQAFKENKDGQVRDHHPEDPLQVGLHPEVGEAYQTEDSGQGHQEMHFKKVRHVRSPRVKFT